MGFLESILQWIAEKILSWLLSKATSALEEKIKDVKQDAERNEINDENTRKYEEAVSRKDSIDAALDLLNRVRRP